MATKTWADRDAVVPIGAPRALCLLVADRSAPAWLREITGAGALVETPARPPLGAMVTLRHPDAGTIDAEVLSHEGLGVRLRFAAGEHAVGFALAAIASGIAARGR